MDRREFLKGTLIGAGAMAVLRMGPVAGAADEPAKPGVLKLCSQAGLVPGGSTKEKAENILKYGGCGLEFGGMDIATAERIRKDLEGTGCGPAALCWGSHGGDLVSSDLAKRKKGMDDLKKVLEAAAALGSTGVIWVPCFNTESTFNYGEVRKEGEQALKDKIAQVTPEIDKAMGEILPELAEFAVKVKARILIEPLNKGEAFYINRLEQAAKFCNQVNSPGLCMMGDFYHMSKEEKDDEAAFVTAGKWLHHVHVATGKSRILPNQEEHDYRPGFKGLKKIGYQDYCSLECGIRPTKTVLDDQGNVVKDDKGKPKMVREPEVELSKTFALLKQQWEEAK